MGSNKTEIICKCGKLFVISIIRLKWGRGKYCSKFCQYRYFDNGGRFKKGLIPWNKGLKGEVTSSYKGKKFPQIENEKHYLWRGNKVGYYGLHSWINRKKGKAYKCDFCKTTTSKRYEWANKSHEYKRNLDDWISLCSKCHWKHDRNFRGIATEIYGL